MGQLRIQHCILNSVTRQYGSRPTSDLLGVNYIRGVPVDTEFPKYSPRFEVFVRFFAFKTRRRRIYVTITWLQPAGRNREVVYSQAFDLPPLGDTDGGYYDHSFKFVNVFIPGEGDYSIRFAQRVRRPWEVRARRKSLAIEYFRVQRAS